MKLIKVTMPANQGDYEDANLESYDLDNVSHAKLVAYWYGTASYEGSGYAIIQHEDGKWDQAYLGHCSCYGPLENYSRSSGVYNTLSELVATFSDELKRDTLAIVEAIREGYNDKPVLNFQI